MRPIFATLLLATTLGSCSSTLEPPQVSEQMRRPANQAAEVELQRCLHGLHNERLRVLEAGTLLESQAAALGRCVRAQAGSARGEPPVTAVGNRVFVIHFMHASTSVQLSQEAAQTLLKAALNAPWIVLHGRTDGLADNLADGRLAKARAEAVRELLIAEGVDAARIRATYQATGDGIAPNTEAFNRSQNRRVEVELYTTVPAPATPINAAG